MTAFSALIGGAAGGLSGALTAHVLVTAANRLGAETWLKGPLGPPFFDVSLYMGVLLAGIAAGSLRSLRAALFGLLGPLIGLALPMAVLTRSASFGLRASRPGANGWYYAVGALYIASTWGTMAVVGAWGARPRRWLGASLACAGAFAGYGLLASLLWLAPSYQRVVWSPTGFVPSPVNLLDGLLSGAGLSLGIFFARSWHEKVRAARS